MIRQSFILQGLGYAGTALAGCTAADGVDDNKRRSFDGWKRSFHLFRSQQLLKPDTGQIITHWLNRITHILIK
ncbi:hypothetical protein D3C80_2108190 [compost metagenome]